MNTLHITTHYGCQEISTPHCTELYGGGLIGILDKAAKIFKLVTDIVKGVDLFLDDLLPSFMEGFKEGWESTR